MTAQGRQIPADQLDEIRCVKCAGFLDTGFECTECGFDMLPIINDAGHGLVSPAPEKTQ